MSHDIVEMVKDLSVTIYGDIPVENEKLKNELSQKIAVEVSAIICRNNIDKKKLCEYIEYKLWQEYDVLISHSTRNKIYRLLGTNR